MGTGELCSLRRGQYGWRRRRQKRVRVVVFPLVMLPLLLRMLKAAETIQEAVLLVLLQRLTGM